MSMTAVKDAPAALPGQVSAVEAHDLHNNGKLTIVDIRTPGEWLRTGVPEGALAISTQNPAFLQEIEYAAGGDKGKPLGVICASGQRSTMVKRFLDESGFSAVTNIHDGVTGNAASPGWLASNLPVTPYAG